MVMLAPLSLPSFVTPEFQEFFRLCRVFRTTLPTGKGRVVHLFVVLKGYQWAEEDADQHGLTDKLLQAVLAEAQVRQASCHIGTTHSCEMGQTSIRIGT